MIKEFHLCLDHSIMTDMSVNDGVPFMIYTTYVDTMRAFDRKDDVIYTTQTSFLQFENAERLFVHVNGESHEIKIGETDGINKELRPAHNLQKLLLAGAFEWFK